MARTSVDADSVVSGLQAAIRQLDPSVPVLEAKTMRRQLEDSLGGAATATAVIGVVGLLALVLACIGLYAVVAFAVSRRSVEIGIRLALGSPNGQLVWLTSRDVLAVVGIGLLFGLGISLALTRALEGFLYGVAPIDPLTLGSVVVLMAAVSSLAAYLPARRAMARNPLEVLRHD
jgi:ABC-type antimicrobial peptide transport system permease subunit